MWSYFTFAHAMWGIWLSIRLCFSTFIGSTFFRTHDIPPEWPNTWPAIALVHGSVWLVSLAFSLPPLVAATTSYIADSLFPSVDAYVLMVGYYPLPSPMNYSIGLHAYWIPFIIILFVTILICCVVLFRLVRLSHLVLRYQFRATLICNIYFISYIPLAIFILLGDSTERSYAASLSAYYTCLLTHQSDPEPVCPDPNSTYYALAVIVSLMVSSVAGSYTIVSYMSYGKTVQFWRALITQREIINVFSGEKTASA